MLMVDRLRGSLLRCLLLTGLQRIKASELLTGLAKPSGAVISSDTDTWMPHSLMNPKEATLVGEDYFLDSDKRKAMTKWWLAAPRYANKPNWDIASTCTIAGRKGLLLVEAKAHDKELSEAGKSEPSSANSRKNHDHIGKAIEEANTGLNSIFDGWALSRDSHYQLSNRFAWSWKLASLGVPVVLIYLGFVNATEMIDQGQPFDSARTWERCILNHAKGKVPENAWNKRLGVAGTPIWFLIRTIELKFNLRH